MDGILTAVYVGGPRCGGTCDVNPDAAPAVILDHATGSHYTLTERVNGRDQPVYAYEPFRAASEAPRGACRCGCRRVLGVDA